MYLCKNEDVLNGGNKGPQEIGISLGISYWEKEKYEAWYHPQKEDVFQEKILQSSDNLLHLLSGQTGAETRMDSMMGKATP